MAAYGGVMGGAFESLGLKGVANMVVGAGLFGLVHGAVTAAIAKYIAVDPENLTDDELLKADGLTSLVMSIVPVGYGIVRTTKYPGEDDVLDFFGNLLGGGLTYEGGSLAEVLGTMIAKRVKVT